MESDLCGSNGGTISNNTVADSGRSAGNPSRQHPAPTCGGPAGGGANVSGNSLNEACAGILNRSSGNTISATNTFFNVINTILVGDSCAAATTEMSQAEIKGSRTGQNPGTAGPALAAIVTDVPIDQTRCPLPHPRPVGVHC